MKRILLSLALICATALAAVAQFNAVITVTDLDSGLPLENATVLLDGSFLATDAAGQATFVGLDDNTYEYSVAATCYTSGIGSITVAGADAASSLALEPIATNTVFFFIGSPLAITGATVQLTDGANYNATLVTSSTFGGETIEGVPFGELSYTISIPCYETVSGTVTVNCNNGDGIAVFAEPEEITTNTVFFFIGSPLAITGATVQLTDGANYNATLVTSSTFGGETIEGVPFGELSYTISIPCYETVSGTVTVNCNNGDGIAVFAEPEEITTNTVFFFIGSPLAITGATVQLTDGANYNATLVTSSTFGGETIEGVPFGDLSYTITIPCYEPVSGTVTVNCNNGDGIAVFAEPTEIVLNTNVSLSGVVLTAEAVGTGYQWVDCNNANEPIDGANSQSFTPTEDGSYAVIITDGDCSRTSACTAVTTTGMDDPEGRDAFTVYPNPFDELFTVRSKGPIGALHMELFDLSGQLVLEETRNGLEVITVPTAQLPAGSYVLRLTSAAARTSMGVVK